MMDAGRTAPAAGEAIAIVGLAARLPGGADAAGFWDSMFGDDPAIGPVPAARWDAARLFGPPGGAPDTSYSTVGGFIDHVDRFDLRHFGIAPREAEAMDPMQRLFMQAAWTALEDAGIPPHSLSGRPVGVFVGVGNAEYAALMREARCDNDAYRATGMALTLVANRLSYLLNLRGPSQVIDTACSGSLVAVHRAVEQLRLGQCELAVAGGVSLMLSPELHVAFSQAGMLSPSGRCRPFDAQADGYVRGEGVGAVVLKRLDDALRDGDFIHARILSSAENHGGRAHSLTAPSYRGQAEVVAAAWQAAGPAIRQLALVETHGTGTPLGDPIEIAGLAEALRLCRAADAQCVPAGPLHLGALKGRIGHLEAAAGIAGLVRAVFALRHGLMPGNPAFARVNPQLELAGSPLQVVDEALPWGDDAIPRVAGVSSFGFGGVNAHVVLQSQPAGGPEEEGAAAAAGVDLVLLSARDDDTLRARAAQLLDYLYPGVQPRVLRALAPACGVTDLDACWQALGLDAPQLERHAATLARLLDVDPAAVDLRDCLNWGEVARAFSDALPRPAATDRLGGRASLSRQALAPSLRCVAASLSVGRDVQARRLAIACEHFSDLALQLAAVLDETPAAHAVSAVAAKDAAGSADLAPPDWRSRDTLATWLREHAASPRLAAALAARYADAPRRVPMPTLPFRLDRVWFKATNATSATTAHDTPAAPGPTRAWPVAPLRALWANSLGTPPHMLPGCLPWPAHGAADAGHGVVFDDVAWGAWTPGHERLIAVAAKGGFDYRAGPDEALRTVLRVAHLRPGASLARPAERGVDIHLPPHAAADDAALWTHWGIGLAKALQTLAGARAPSALLLPYRAARVAWAGEVDVVPQRFTLWRDPHSGRVEVTGWAGARLLLRIEQLELREARWLGDAAVRAGSGRSAGMRAIA